MKNKEYIREQINKLRTYIFNGDYGNVDLWFSDQKKTDIKEIESEIINAAYLFGFRSTNLDREYNNKETIKRHCAILKNVSLDTQLKLFYDMKDEFCKEHVDCLKLNKKKATLEYLHNNITIQYVVTHLFSLERFSEIDLLKQKTGIDLLNTTFDSMTINYSSKSMKGAYTANLFEKINKPVSNIIVEFTENKMNYLLKNNYELPDREYVEKLKELLKKSIHNALYHTVNAQKEISELMEKKSVEYLIIKDYCDLQKIENKEQKKIKRNKI